MKYEHAITCARRGDVDFFKTVAPKILLKAADDYNRSVLTVAATEGHLDCCEVIVERCTQLLYHQDNRLKRSVLHYVAALNHDNNLENILRFLITADSKPDLELGGGAKIPNNRLLTMQNYRGMTALHRAVERGNHWATKLLLEADRDFELLRMVNNYNGETCLHTAAIEGDHVSAELMIKAWPDIEFLKMTERQSNQTALHYAVKEGYLEMVKLICEADPDKQLLSMPDSQGNTPLHLAVKNNKLAVAKLLLEAYHSNDLLAMVDSHQQTTLHIAVETGNLDVVKLICEAGLDKQLLSMPDSQGNTPLHLAMDKAAARHRFESDSLVICKLLLENDPSQCTIRTGDKGWTPLHLAASHGLNGDVMDIIRLCSDCIYTMDFHGQNVLHIAAYHGHPDVVKQFLERDVALLNTQDEDGNTPLHLAVYKGNVEVVRLLLKPQLISEHRANISIESPYTMAKGKILSQKYGECSKSDLELGGGAKIPNKRLLTMQNKYGDTALHLAVAKRNHEVTKLLLKADNEFELLPMVDKHGRTCLHIAAYRGDHESARLIINAKPDDEFLKMTTTHLKRTTLHIATLRMLSDKCGEYSKSGSEIVRMLLEKDPKQCIKLVETHKHTFIHTVVKLGLNDVVENILKLKEIEATVLNIQDTDGNTPLHIAAFGQNKRMTLCLLYDARVSKEIENNKKEKAIDLINFPYDEAKAKVYSLGHQIDLKDQSSFDLLVAALIATVSFTAGITVPGGYVSDGTNKGSAILLKATAFKVFIVSNNFALLFSLYTVFLNFSTRRLLKKDDIYYESKTGTFRARLQRKKDDMFYQFNTATLCTLSAIYAMVVAFITGSYAVLNNSDGLAITVCVCSCFFLILASHATWTMVMQYWCQKVEPEVSS